MTTCATATRTVYVPSSSVCPPGSASSNAWGVTVTPREPSLTWWMLGNTRPPSLSSPSLPCTPLTEVGEANPQLRRHRDQLWVWKSNNSCSCRSAAGTVFGGFCLHAQESALTLNSNGSLDFLAASPSCFVQHNLGQTCFCSYNANLKEEFRRKKSSRKEMKESLPLGVKSFSAQQPPN